MTSLLDRWAWDTHASHVLSEVRENHQSVALLVVDLDGFKQVNDTFGHLTGDEALRATAGELMRSVRPSDLVGRFGGDEFLVLIPGADYEQALAIAQRIGTGVAAIGLDVAASAAATATVRNLTASIGVAVSDQADAETLLRRADAALFAAKRAGRSRICLASSDADDRWRILGPDRELKDTPGDCGGAESWSGSRAHEAVPGDVPPAYWHGLYDVVQLLKGEWVPAILASLAAGPRHFTEILSTIHDTTVGQPNAGRWLHDSILGRTLRRMEEKGLVIRHEQEARFPKSTVYELSSPATSLLMALAPAANWASTRGDGSPSSRPSNEVHLTGHVFRPAV